MSPKFLKLCSVIGAVRSDISKFVQTRNPIRNKYPNQPKPHKLQEVFLVEVDAKVMQLGVDSIMGFFFTHSNIPEPTILRRQEIHTCDQIGWRGNPLCLSRGYCPRCQCRRHSYSGSCWKQSYWWCRSKRLPDFTINLYVKSTFRRHGGALPSRYRYQWWYLSKTGECP